MRKPILLALLLICIAVIVPAQEDGEWYIGKPIKDIVFKGLDKISAEQLEPITKPFIGKDFSQELFWDLQSKLYALDYFVQIIPNAKRADPEGNAVIIEFTVTERPLVDELVFNGNRRIRTGEILDVIVLKEGDMITQSRLRLDQEAIRDLYLERGFPDVEVNVETEEEDGKNRVVFTIEEGYQTSIRDIDFSGNTFASESTLRGVLESKTQNIFNPGTFKEKNIEQDIENLERYYREHGYVDAEVVDVQRKVERDEEDKRSFMTLTYYIEEGEQYTYEGMSFEGNLIFTDEELSELVRQQPGKPVNMTKVNNDYQRIVERYWGDGYIFNLIEKREFRDEANNTVSYVIEINEQPRAHIENIIITGNEKTKDYVLEREIPLEVGDVFSRTKIIEGIQNLYNTQYFSNVTTDAPPGSEPGLMDLVINVEEQNTADIRFGIAFGGSSEFPVSAQMSIQDINFLGRGQTLGGELIISPINQRISGNFQEDWLFGYRWSGGISLTLDRTINTNQPQDILFPIFSEDDTNAVPDPYDGHYVYSEGANAGQAYPGIPTQQEIEDNNLVTDWEYDRQNNIPIPDQYLMDYVTWDIALGLSTGYRLRTMLGLLGLSTSFRPSLSYVNYDQNLYRPFDPNVRKNFQKLNFINRWSFGVSLDTRDFILSPSSGYYLSQGLTLTGGFLFGERHYIKTETKGEAFITLWDLPVFENWNWKVVLAMHSAVSFVLPQFWVPAGYDKLETTTSDLLMIDGMYVGRGWPRETDGRALWDNWIEFRMPIAEQVLWLDTFFDAVALWDTPNDMAGMLLKDYRFGFGMGLRFTIPQFPIRLYLAKRFKFDNQGNWEWQQGQLFPDSLGLDFVFSIGTELF